MSYNTQEFKYCNDDVFVGTNAGYFAKNKIEYVADYFPYGKVLREFVESDEERFLTTQHERDAETGLDYRGARYYDADMARFLSLDPLAANYVAWAPYHYVLGNPITYIDPTGKSSESTGEESTGWTDNHVHLNEVFGDNYGFNSTINGMMLNSAPPLTEGEI